MVSPDFIGQRAVARHQRVYAELSDVLAGPVHALAMHLYDPDEWLRRGGPAPGSPDCLGGSKADEGAAR
jgi:BolA protein